MINILNNYCNKENGLLLFNPPTGSGKTHSVLKWIFERCEGTAEAIETPIGNLPTLDAIDFDGLGLSDDAIAELLRVEVDGWLAEIPLIEEYYAQFGSHIPEELNHELANLKSKLEQARVSAA